MLDGNGSILKDIKTARNRDQKNQIFRYAFHMYWFSYIFAASILGAILILSQCNISIIDAWFLSTSAIVNGGLSTISMSSLTNNTFMILGLLMLFGNSTFMLLPPIFYRYYRLTKLKVNIIKYLSAEIQDDDKSRVVEYYVRLQKSLRVAIIVISSYILFFLAFGTAMLTIILNFVDSNEELQERGFTNFQNALFLAVSAFSNTGLTLSSSNMTIYNKGDNTIFIFIVCGILILAGNTFFPMFVRLYILLIQKTLLYIRDHQMISNNRERLIRFDHSFAETLKTLQFILDNPRNMCTLMFNTGDSFYLFQMGSICFLFEWIIFLTTTCYHNYLSDTYGSVRHVAGLGLFQVLNTRHCGFQVFNMRDLPDAMLYVIAFMMLLSAAPYIGLLHRTTGKCMT